ncbi:MAG: chemotaxis protein CheW [Gallionellales bacterium 35-53-114]|jgi:purine-binding chemotaxis protein CheW|nr:MAG: chemotaxis protein CheW [Gallionellales bacterium 35-53-114]OYZ62918.1 MAG: chemotaxis protein CheW [Gallionellales bacterium 24-53-125]OZB09995.1 MAG: chemotaxis protein CheW [Gallionellales bacterium 39-52-133]HQS58333.1 chemotaxis protein CheW [Gallionellaceae bacterium]HQS73888.1 chemotaxis protein CheW [Gallionellaceae bacterium]
MNTDKGKSSAGKRVVIDWSEIRQRQEAVRGAIELATLPDAEQTQRILKARALALGRNSEAEEATGEHIEVVEFVLAQERYAVETRHVRDVYPLVQLTPVPCTPNFVLGVVNLRSEILSVIDIRKFFDMPEKGLTDLNKVIVLESASMCFGILADAIAGVRQIAVTDIQPSLPTLTGIREEYLQGVTPGRTVILDAGKLLSDSKIVVQEQVEG